MVRKAKKLVKEKGILAIPNPRVMPFPQETVDQVMAFYKSEEISQTMPGKKDFLSVVKDGKKSTCSEAPDFVQFRSSKRSLLKGKLAFQNLQH